MRFHFNFVKINLFDFSIFFEAFCIFLNFHWSFIKLNLNEFTLILTDRIQMNVLLFGINRLVAAEKSRRIRHVLMIAIVKTIYYWVSLNLYQIYLILWVQMVSLVTVLFQLMIFVVNHIFCYLTLFQNILILNYFLSLKFCSFIYLLLLFCESFNDNCHVCLVHYYIRCYHFFI